MSFLFGLKSNGTVESCGTNTSGTRDVSGWNLNG